MFPGIVPGKPALVLAPMEGVTDAPMRAFQSRSGAFQYCVSEFLRVCHQVPPKKVFWRHVPELRAGGVTPFGTPVQVQLLGGNADALALSAVAAVEAGAAAIDLNFGCPAPTVNRHDGGATLLKYPLRIREIVAAVRARVPLEIPVSAKLRLGWDDARAIFETAAAAAEGGASWLTIHARTRMAGYQPPVDWECVGEVRQQLPIPVVANGDIWSVEDFLLCRKQTGCEHFMLGRGALADPMLPERVANCLGISVRSNSRFLETQPKYWAGVFDALRDETPYPESRTMARRVKQWAGMAHRRGAIDWFETIKRFNEYEEIRQSLLSL